MIKGNRITYKEIKDEKIAMRDKKRLVKKIRLQ